MPLRSSCQALVCGTWLPTARARPHAPSCCPAQLCPARGTRCPDFRLPVCRPGRWWCDTAEHARWGAGATVSRQWAPASPQQPSHGTGLHRSRCPCCTSSDASAAPAGRAGMGATTAAGARATSWPTTSRPASWGPAAAGGPPSCPGARPWPACPRSGACPCESWKLLSHPSIPGPCESRLPSPDTPYPKPCTLGQPLEKPQPLRPGPL